VRDVWSMMSRNRLFAVLLGQRSWRKSCISPQPLRQAKIAGNRLWLLPLGDDKSGALTCVY